MLPCMVIWIHVDSSWKKSLIKIHQAVCYDCYFLFIISNVLNLEEYLSNVLETALLHKKFVYYWFKDFKLWLPFSYFLIMLNYGKFKQDLTKLIPSILQGLPLDVFNSIDLPKIQREDPYEMTNINFVQSCSNFPQFSKIEK